MTDSLAQLKVAIGARLEPSPLVLLLDIDGTISPIAPTPAAAMVPEHTQTLLRSFVRMPDVVVGLVTGRSIESALGVLTLEGAWLIGNHGFELRTPDGELTRSDAARPFDSRLGEARDLLSEIAASVPGTFIEDKHSTVSLHYRLADRESVPDVVRRADEVGSRLGLTAIHGKQIVELRPPVDVTKGTASIALAERVGALNGGAVLYAGDDRTDEDAFHALRARKADSVTIRVASREDHRETRAEFIVSSTEELRLLLAWLLERRSMAKSRG